MAPFSSRMAKAIKHLEKSNANSLVKIERHQRRMEALKRTMDAKADMITKLRAWEPYLESVEKLEFMLETITRGDQATANRSKDLILAAVESFKKGESTEGDLIESLEGINVYFFFYMPVVFFFCIN